MKNFKKHFLLPLLLLGPLAPAGQAQEENSPNGSDGAVAGPTQDTELSPETKQGYEEAKGIYLGLFDVERLAHSFQVYRITKDEELKNKIEAFETSTGINLVNSSYIDEDKCWPNFFKWLDKNRLEKDATSPYYLNRVVFTPTLVPGSHKVDNYTVSVSFTDSEWEKQKQEQEQQQKQESADQNTFASINNDLSVSSVSTTPSKEETVPESEVDIPEITSILNAGLGEKTFSRPLDAKSTVVDNIKDEIDYLLGEKNKKTDERPKIYYLEDDESQIMRQRIEYMRLKSSAFNALMLSLEKGIYNINIMVYDKLLTEMKGETCNGLCTQIPGDPENLTTVIIRSSAPNEVITEELFHAFQKQVYKPLKNGDEPGGEFERTVAQFEAEANLMQVFVEGESNGHISSVRGAICDLAEDEFFEALKSNEYRITPESEISNIYFEYLKLEEEFNKGNSIYGGNQDNLIPHAYNKIILSTNLNSSSKISPPSCGVTVGAEKPGATLIGNGLKVTGQEAETFVKMVKGFLRNIYISEQGYNFNENKSEEDLTELEKTLINILDFGKIIEVKAVDNSGNILFDADIRDGGDNEVDMYDMGLLSDLPKFQEAFIGHFLEERLSDAKDYMSAHGKGMDKEIKILQESYPNITSRSIHLYKEDVVVKQKTTGNTITDYFKFLDYGSKNEGYSNALWIKYEYKKNDVPNVNIPSGVITTGELFHDIYGIDPDAVFTDIK